jgi:16S rRNA processing protein RimM
LDAGIPDDAVEVGRIHGAWGVKGWIKVQPFSSDPQALFSSKRWFLKPPEGNPARPSAMSTQVWPDVLRVEQAREQGDGIVAAIHDLDDRDAAESLRGGRIFVSRSSFPTASDDEYYWVDLIGLPVYNRDGVLLGEVTGLIDTGAHSVLQVCQSGALAGKPAESVERLIPFVAAYIDKVDVKGKRIEVDWGLDY